MNRDLLYEVNQFSKQQIELCYHCHKCTAGCPVVEAMDYGPDRILRMIILGQDETVLKSRDIWLCVGCFTCAIRCPNEIDIAAVMDGLRQVAQKRHVLAGQRDALLFHQLFLGVVRLLGRSHEAIMLGLFKVLSHVPIWNDLGAGLALFLRGKVPLLPARFKGKAKMKEFFQFRRGG